MKEQISSPRPEVDLNPNSDLPAAGVISTEISPNVTRVSDGGTPLTSLPFGVLSGKKVSPAPTESTSENLKP